MTTFHPRPAYTAEELDKLYPSQLQLQLVQVILRHGERSPVSARFQNAGLPAYWPYCNAARRMKSAIMTTEDGSSWTHLDWRRRLESFGSGDSPTLASGTPAGAKSTSTVEGVCNMGELTDQGRATTLALGQRLRQLYVEQLGFMPSMIANADAIYLRATPIPRALESVQQAFAGLYPLSARAADFPSPTIITRTPAEETLFPNDGGCKRFNQLSRAFAARTAERWNDSPELAYVTSKIGKWMPEDSPRVAVDSHPRLSGVMDTINSTLAHPAPTRLPKEFYDQKARAIIDKIGVEEWFSGFKESAEYRRVGIGAMVADVVERMVGSAEEDHSAAGDGLAEVVDVKGRGSVSANKTGPAVGRGGETAIRFCMSGAHDTTLAAMLTALGAFDGEDWPPYTSHVAVELFKRKQQPSSGITTISSSRPIGLPPSTTTNKSATPQSSLTTFFSRLLSPTGSGSGSSNIGRRPLASLTDDERARLDGYYVRLRFNDRVMRVPACAQPGKNLDGDESFCTLEAFKKVVDGFTPKDWRKECMSNLGKSAFPERDERSEA